MIIVKEKTLCKICRKNDAVIYYDGCRSPLCRDCRKFDMWNCGCGHIDIKGFCSTCFDDIKINPRGGKRPIE